MLAFAIRTILFGWASRFAAQRAAVFWDGYRRYSREWNDNIETWRTCQSLNGPTRACAEVHRALDRSPLLRALDDVAEMTHLCGDTKCSEVYWAGLALGAFSLLVALMAARQVKQIVSDGTAPIAWRDPRRRPCPDPKWCELPASALED